MSITGLLGAPAAPRTCYWPRRRIWSLSDFPQVQKKCQIASKNVQIFDKAFIAFSSCLLLLLLNCVQWYRPLFEQVTALVSPVSSRRIHPWIAAGRCFGELNVQRPLWMSAQSDLVFQGETKHFVIPACSRGDSLCGGGGGEEARGRGRGVAGKRPEIQYQYERLLGSSSRFIRSHYTAHLVHR